MINDLFSVKKNSDWLPSPLLERNYGKISNDGQSGTAKYFTTCKITKLQGKTRVDVSRCQNIGNFSLQHFREQHFNEYGIEV